MHQIIGGRLADPIFAERYAPAMFRLRYRIFHERLGWAVKTHGDQEVDEFDDAHSHYLLLADCDELIGGWRLRPTTRPYLLERAFPQLLGDLPAPRHDAVWEISRFAIDTSGATATRFGLNAAARQLLSATAQFALDHGVQRYVMVASAGAERLYRNAGLVVHRFAPPQQVGVARSVACWVDIDDHTCRALLGHGLPLAAAA